MSWGMLAGSKVKVTSGGSALLRRRSVIRVQPGTSVLTSGTITSFQPSPSRSTTIGSFPKPFVEDGNKSA